MASGIFLLLDDIAMLADDVAVASKVATKKTAAILGDDLAVNAQKATGLTNQENLWLSGRLQKDRLKIRLLSCR